jgi:hypothetical protein
MAVMTAASPMTAPISVRTLRSLCAHGLEAEITTSSERFIVRGEPDWMVVDMDTSAMKGPHPNIGGRDAGVTLEDG